MTALRQPASGCPMKSHRLRPTADGLTSFSTNDKNNGPNHSAACDVIAAQIDPFIVSLKAAGYAACTICTKRAALQLIEHSRKRFATPARALEAKLNRWMNVS